MFGIHYVLEIDQVIFYDVFSKFFFLVDIDNSTSCIYGSFGASLTILSGTLRSNRTYQFMVYMENAQGSSGTGSVFVTVVDGFSPAVSMG